MRVEFKASFLKDIRAIKDRSVLSRVQEIITLVEEAETLSRIANLKRLKGGS